MARRLVLYRWREVLQEFVNAVLHVLEVLLLVTAGTDRLCCPALPDLLLGGHGIHVEDQRPVIDGRTGGLTHAAETAHAKGIPLLLLLDGCLITNQQIG